MASICLKAMDEIGRKNITNLLFNKERAPRCNKVMMQYQEFFHEKGHFALEQVKECAKHFSAVQFWRVPGGSTEFAREISFNSLF